MRFDVVEYLNRDAAEQVWLSRVDDAATAARSRYVTLIPGQDEIYTEKVRLAKKVKSKNFNVSDPEDRMLQSEADARGISIETLVNEIVAKHEDWAEIRIDIEALRISGKEQVRTASLTRDVIRAGKLAVHQLSLV